MYVCVKTLELLIASRLSMSSISFREEQILCRDVYQIARSR